jgi:hypothetical protein
MGAFGDAHPRATVTEDQVRQIIQLLQSRKTQKEVARQFGVNRLVVEGIASGRNWQHVPRPANFDTTIRHRAKLTEDQVREIRHLLKAGVVLQGADGPEKTLSVAQRYAEFLKIFVSQLKCQRRFRSRGTSPRIDQVQGFAATRQCP